jgi:hypothetical protein
MSGRAKLAGIFRSALVNRFATGGKVIRCGGFADNSKA